MNNKQYFNMVTIPKANMAFNTAKTAPTPMLLCTAASK